ncbi:hypothetical protein ACFL4G_04915 [Thermodesulfobacteriota bacterium]
MKRIGLYPTLIIAVFLFALTGCPPPEPSPAPFISFSEPGNEFNNNDTINVSGTVWCPEGRTISSVSVNSQAMSFTDTTFYGSVSLPPSAERVRPLMAEIVDSTGRVGKDRLAVLRGTSKETGQPIDWGYGARLNQGLFDLMTQMVWPYLQDIDLDEFILPLNPILDEEIDVWGFTIASARADLTGAHYSSVDFDLTAANGYLDLYASVNGFQLDFSLRGEIMEIGYSCGGDVEVDHARVYLDVGMSADAGDVVLTPVGVNVSLAGFDIDTSCLPFDFENLFNGIVRRIIENVAENMVVNTAFPEINNILDDLDFTYSIAFFQISTAFSGFVQDSIGETIHMDTNVFPLIQVNPMEQGGYMFTDNPTPIMTGTVPGTGEPYDLSMFVSDEVINAALYSVAEAGNMNIEFNEIEGQPLNIGFLTTFFPAFQAFDPTVPARITLSPTVAPYMTMAPGDPPPISIILPNYMLQVDFEFPEGLSMALKIGIDASLAISAAPLLGNAIQFSLESFGFNAYVLEEPLIDVNEIGIETLVPFAIDLIEVAVVGPIAEFPIPAFSGIQLVPLQIRTCGTGNDFLGIYGGVDLIPTD